MVKVHEVRLQHEKQKQEYLVNKSLFFVAICLCFLQHAMVILLIRTTQQTCCTSGGVSLVETSEPALSKLG